MVSSRLVKTLIIALRQLACSARDCCGAGCLCAGLVHSDVQLACCTATRIQKMYTATKFGSLHTSTQRVSHIIHVIGQGGGQITTAVNTSCRQEQSCWSKSILTQTQTL